jgi:hypothetical protein
MKDEERKYLRKLPAHIKVEFQLNEDKLNLLLVHGSPRKTNGGSSYTCFISFSQKKTLPSLLLML